MIWTELQFCFFALFSPPAFENIGQFLNWQVFFLPVFTLVIESDGLANISTV